MLRREIHKQYPLVRYEKIRNGEVPLEKKCWIINYLHDFDGDLDNNEQKMRTWKNNKSGLSLAWGESNICDVK